MCCLERLVFLWTCCSLLGLLEAVRPAIFGHDRISSAGLWVTRSASCMGGPVWSADVAGLLSALLGLFLRLFDLIFGVTEAALGGYFSAFPGFGCWILIGACQQLLGRMLTHLLGDP